MVHCEPPKPDKSYKSNLKFIMSEKKDFRYSIFYYLSNLSILLILLFY